MGISLDKFLKPYIDDFVILTRIYKMLKEVYDSMILKKTLKNSQLVHYKKVGKTKPILEIYEGNANIIIIEESRDPKNKKVSIF